VNSPIVQIVPYRDYLIALHADGALSAVHVRGAEVVIVPLWRP
jgi:hypothetical protein